MATPKHQPFTEDDQTLGKDKADAVDVVTGEIVPAGVAAMVRTVASTEVVEFLAKLKQEQEADPAQVQLAIVERILSSQTVEEVFAESDVYHAQDLVDQPLIVNGVRFNRSDFDGVLAGYALMECADPDGGPDFLVSCGAVSVMAQLYRLGQLGAFPMPLFIQRAAKPTKAGYWPLRLRPNFDEPAAV